MYRKFLAAWFIAAWFVTIAQAATGFNLPGLGAGGAVSAGDLLLSRQGANTIDKKITAAQLKTFMSASPTFTNPALGTPASGVATNLTGTATALSIGGNAATATTAGTLTTALSANQILGSLTAVAPTGLTVPSCSTSASALLWTSGSGLSCNTAIAASTATTATNATNTAITDDTSTNATMYLTWVTANTGNLPQKTSSNALTYNPGTGTLSATNFNGAITSTSTVTTQPANSNSNAPASTGHVKLAIAAASDLFAEAKTTGTPISVKTEYQTVAGSATQTLFDYTGSGYVSSVFMAVSYTSGASVNTGTVNIYIDGSGTPSVSMPAESFFESRYMDNAASPNAYFNSKYFGANCNGATNTNCSMYSRLPIPFSTEVKVTFTNGSASAITFWSDATIQSGVAPSTWTRTRKMYAVENLIDAPAANTTETLLNIAPGVKGRIAGIWMLNDEFPHTMNPIGASWEGNFRFYTDNFTKTWIASTAYAVNDTIIDSNGNLQTVTSVSSDAKTNGSAPTWSQVSGATTSDNHVTWTQTPGTPNQTWIASKPYALHMAVLDSNGYVQRVTTAGTSNSTIPAFSSTPGATTSDNTVTWTNQGNTYAHTAYQSSGTEDLFMMGFYGQGAPAMTSSNGLTGTTYCSTSPLSPTSVTRSMYRFFIDDPITFESSLAVTWQAGDTSQVGWTSGSPKVWIVVYYYTE